MGIFELIRVPAFQIKSFCEDRAIISKVMGSGTMLLKRVKNLAIFRTYIQLDITKVFCEFRLFILRN